MAGAPLLLMSKNSSATREMSTPTATFSEEIRTEPIQRQPRAKRATKPPGPKKPPQRGLGVAQLERLRVQEAGCKKASEMNNFQLHHHLQTPPFQTPYDSPPYGLPGYCVTSPSLTPFPGPARSFVGMVTGRVAASPYGFAGAPVPAVHGGNGVLEASRELSSTPNNAHCNPDCCSTFIKKKGSNVQNMGLERARSDSHQDRRSSITRMDNVHDFLELNLGNNLSSAGSTARVGREGIGRCVYASQPDLDREVEVMAVRRKVNSVGGSVLLEYEFFPGKSSCDRSPFSQELNIPAVEEAAAAAFAATSCGDAGAGAGATTGEASHSVDLSLKLSSY